MAVNKKLLMTAVALCAAILLASPLALLDAHPARKSRLFEKRSRIKGVVVAKPVRQPFKMPTLEDIMAAGGGRGGSTGGPPARRSDKGSIPAIYVDNGKYVPEKSKGDAVTAGVIQDTYGEGVKVVSGLGNVGGVYVKGIASHYLLSDADIDLSGNGTGTEGGMSTGAAATDHSTLILRHVTISTSGTSRCATGATQYSTMKVYNSTLTAHGAPFSEDKKVTGGIKRPFQGNARTNVTMSNSYSYFYYSTIVADGWGALSTDGAEGFVYLEADHCKIKTIKSGYGTYADGSCHNFFNDCDFDTANMAAIMAGESDITFRDCRATCGDYFVMIHCVMGVPAEVSTLKVFGGKIRCKKAAVLVKSQNAILKFDGVKITSGNGILIKSVVNDDPNATKTHGKKVYGIHATFRDMEVSGDILHEDTDRDMWVNLEQTTILKGAIKDAYLTLDESSKWIATGDSKVTLVGDVNPSQIDAPAGVTITAVAGEKGTYRLRSGGTLVLREN